MNQYLTGQAVYLSAMTDAHFERFCEIESETNTLLLANDEIPFPLTTEDHTQFFNAISGKKEEYVFGIFEQESNELIGSCSAFSMNWKNSTCYVGIVIGSQWQHKGYGTDAMKILTSFIFNYINVNKIKLEVFSFNKAAIRSYEKCHFVQEGVLRDEVFRFGKFHDVVLFGLLRQDWLKSQS